jgi:hypothetical protein
MSLIPNIRKDTAHRVAAGFLIVILFLAVFSILVWARQGLPKDAFQDVQWIFLLALVAVLPFFLEYARPLVSSFEIPNLLKVDLRGLEAKSLGLKDLVDRNLIDIAEAREVSPAMSSQILDDFAGINLESYTNRLMSIPSPVIQKVMEINEKDAEILPIDLGTGKNWLFINLYFLALLSAQRTKADHFVFIETDGVRDGIFIGLVHLRDLLEVLSSEFPLLAKASEDLDYRYGRLDNSLGSDFFKALNEALKEAWYPESYKRWVTSASLIPILGTALRTGAVEYKDELNEEDLRQILSSPARYTAVVRAGQYLFAMDREKVSLNIVRKIAFRG